MVGVEYPQANSVPVLDWEGNTRPCTHVFPTDVGSNSLRYIRKSTFRTAMHKGCTKNANEIAQTNALAKNATNGAHSGCCAASVIVGAYSHRSVASAFVMV